VKEMWNGTHFCDGICSDVKGASLLMSNMFGLAFGFPQAQGQEATEAAWNLTASWGLENIGDYGAFWYLHAIGGGYYTDMSSSSAADDGSAILKALAKCDEDSWCSGIQNDNLTMTRESWHAGTYSHQWGSSAIVGVVWGLMGIHQTSPAWKTFTVKPKMGSLTSASIKVPTIRGFITVTAKAGESVEVEVPCGSQATLCFPRSSLDADSYPTTLNSRLILDDLEVPAFDEGGHLCTRQWVGCGASGSSRRLRAEPQ